MINLKNYYSYIISVFSILIALLFPLSAEASTGIIQESGGSFNDQVISWTNSINDLAPSISFMFSALFTIMFLFGIVRMGYSMVTKTGQIMKGSSGLLIWVPITFFLIRILILMVFTTDGKNVTLVASDIISLIKSTSYYTSIGIVLIGLVLFLFYRLIEHPEFGRWSKRLWALAALLAVLTTIIPFVLGAA